MGIFSIDVHDDIRQTLRETWLQSRYACPYYEYYRMKFSRIKKDCSIYYAFVFGNDAQVYEPDALIVPIIENMNDGKTYEWFKFAVEHFPEFNYIAKADQVFFLFFFFFFLSYFKLIPFAFFFFLTHHFICLILFTFPSFLKPNTISPKYRIRMSMHENYVVIFSRFHNTTSITDTSERGSRAAASHTVQSGST